jgi:hypothetical protein
MQRIHLLSTGLWTETPILSPQSWRRETSGSTRVARRAGM